MGLFDIRAAIRGGLNAGYSPVALQANEKGELLTAQGMPPYAEMARKGQYYGTMATAAVAALVVRPSTAAALGIQNNSLGAFGVPLNMVISTIFAHELVTSTTGLGGGAVQYASVSLPMAPLTDAALAINSLTGRPPATKSVLTTAALTVTDNGWFPWGNTVKKESAGAVVPGGALWTDIAGRIIVPPGSCLLLHVVSGYVGDTFTNGATWYWEAMSNIQ